MKRYGFFIWGDFLKKLFVIISTVTIFSCGYVLHMSYSLSGAAAWSLIVSSVNSSPWELVKPFVIVYIMWCFVEMSVLRPSLLHFVCTKILSLHMFTIASTSILCFIQDEMVSIGLIFLILFIAQVLAYFMYRSECRYELFFVPIMVSFAVLFAFILFCSFYPPQFLHFYDKGRMTYGLLL